MTASSCMIKIAPSLHRIVFHVIEDEPNLTHRHSQRGKKELMQNKNLGHF